MLYWRVSVYASEDGMKQVIAEGLCLKLSDFFRQLDVKLFGSYIVFYIMCVNVCGGEFETVNL